ncbi:MAG: hypothetical protein ACYC4P_15355 [Thermoanaerobaculia bacterium]
MSRARRALLPVLVGLVGLVATLRVPIASGLTRIHEDEGDARHLNYVLEHVHRWATGDAAHRGLWSPPVFFPVKNTGAYSELLLGVAPLYVPFRLAGAPPDVALQLFVAAALALNFLAGWALFRRGFGAGALGASAGAYLFAFGALRAQRLGHQHLLPHFFTALAVLALIEAIRQPESGRPDRRNRWLGVFFAALVAQVYAGVYLAFFLGLALAASAAVALALPSTRAPFLAFVRERAPVLLGGAALSALALVPLAVPYARAAREVGFRGYEMVAPFLPPLKAWLNPGPFRTLYGSWLGAWDVVRELPFAGEKAFFPGLLTALLVVWGLALGRERTALRVAALAGAALILLTTSWPGGHSLWRFVYEVVPGAKAMRAVGRFSFLLLIPAGAAVAYAVDRLFARRGTAVTAAVLLLFGAEQLSSVPSYDREPVRRRVERVARAIGPECGAFYYSPILSGRPHWETQLDGMWASLETGIPTVNGYSSNLPPGWGPLMEHELAVADEARVGDRLAAWIATKGLPPASVCWVQLDGKEPPRR